MGNKYRITFSDGPSGNYHKTIDVSAKDSDEAFGIAYKMPEAKDRRYTDISVQEIKTGPKIIGLEISYYDTALKQTSVGYMFIKAENEDQAVEYYNKHLKGGRFWFNAGKTDPTGKCVRGDILDMYFAISPSYNFDATKELSESNFFN